MEKETTTVRITKELKWKLKKIASEERRSIKDIVEELIKDYLQEDE